MDSNVKRSLSELENICNDNYILITKHYAIFEGKPYKKEEAS